MSSVWSNEWPRKIGVYLFFGYAISKGVEPIPRLHLVTLEYVSKVFGLQLRTSRYTIKKESGAYGMWMEVMAPMLPELDEVKADKAARYTKEIKELRFVE